MGRTPSPLARWFPSCGKNGVTSLTQKKVLRTPCGAPSVTVMDPPHCLEITPPSSEKSTSVMTLSDLSTEDDDSGRYDKKIDSLMNEVKMQKGCEMDERVQEEMEEALNELQHEYEVLKHNTKRIKKKKDFIMRLTDLVNQHKSLEEKMREDLDSLVERRYQKTKEYSALKLENEMLKASFAPMEDKLNQARLEVQQLKVAVKNYEGMIDNSKSQVMKTLLEADEVATQLERYDKENKILDEMNKQIEAARRQLKTADAKLAEYQDPLQGYERNIIDVIAIISDLRSRVRDWQKVFHELDQAGSQLPR